MSSDCTYDGGGCTQLRLYLHLNFEHPRISRRICVLRCLEIAFLEKARALKAQITPFTWALLAKNLPFERASSTRSSPNGSIVTVKRGKGVESAAEAADQNAVCTATAAVPSSLRHEVCHRLLSERFLSDTSYASTGESPEGLGRALVALRVLLDDEDDLLEARLDG